MRYVIIALLLNACASTSRVFSISENAPEKDKAYFKQAVNEINSHLGCEKVFAYETTKVYTKGDAKKGYNYVAFSNEPSIKAALDARGSSELGLTTITGSVFNCNHVSCVDTYDIDLIDFSQLNPADYYDQSTLDAFALHVIIHEIGHSFGLRHTENPYDVMYPDTSPTNAHLDGNSWLRFVKQLNDSGVSCEVK